MKKINFNLNPKTIKILKAAVVIFAVAFPFIFTSSYVQHIAVMCGIYIVLTLSLNLNSGFCGQISMGHAAFYGIGAYVTALTMTQLGMNFWLTLIFSMGVSGLFGLILGIPTSKLKGDYLSIVTLGFGEIVRLFLINAVDITNGPAGVTGIDSPSILGFQFISDRSFYYLILVLVVLVTVFIKRIINSGFGLAMMSIRENEIAAQSIGIKPMKYKLLAFVLSSMLAGLAGSFYATYVTYVSPNTFLFNDSATLLAMMVLGGIGSIPGSLIGAILLTVLPELLRSFSEYRMIVYGLAMVVMMNVRPTGFWGREKRVRNEYKLQLGGTQNEKNIAG